MKWIFKFYNIQKVKKCKIKQFHFQILNKEYRIRKILNLLNVITWYNQFCKLSRKLNSKNSILLFVHFGYILNIINYFEFLALVRSYFKFEKLLVYNICISFVGFSNQSMLFMLKFLHICKVNICNINSSIFSVSLQVSVKFQRKLFIQEAVCETLT